MLKDAHQPTAEEYAMYIGTAWEISQQDETLDGKQLRAFVELVATTLWNTRSNTQMAKLCYYSLALIATNPMLSHEDLAEKFRSSYLIDPHLPTGILEAAKEIDAEIAMDRQTRGIETQAKVTLITADFIY